MGTPCNSTDSTPCNSLNCDALNDLKIDKNSYSSLIPGLPLDLAINCLARVPIIDRIKLRQVSLSWYNSCCSKEINNTRRSLGLFLDPTPFCSCQLNTKSLLIKYKIEQKTEFSKVSVSSITKNEHLFSLFCGACSSTKRKNKTKSKLLNYMAMRKEEQEELFSCLLSQLKEKDKEIHLIRKCRDRIRHVVCELFDCKKTWYTNGREMEFCIHLWARQIEGHGKMRIAKSIQLRKIYCALVSVGWEKDFASTVIDCRNGSN